VIIGTGGCEKQWWPSLTVHPFQDIFRGGGQSQNGEKYLDSFREIKGYSGRLFGN